MSTLDGGPQGGGRVAGLDEVVIADAVASDGYRSRCARVPIGRVLALFATCAPSLAFVASMDAERAKATVESVRHMRAKRCRFWRAWLASMKGRDHRRGPWKPRA